MKIAFQPMLRQLQRELARNIATGRFEMTKPLEAMKRGREFGARKPLIEDRALPDFHRLPRQAEPAMHERFRVLEQTQAGIFGVESDPVRHRAIEALARKAWPPKPGLTVMMRTRSSKSKTGSRASTGVPGLST